MNSEEIKHLLCAWNCSRQCAEGWGVEMHQAVQSLREKNHCLELEGEGTGVRGQFERER